jgi:hypothetical protein
VEHEYGTEEVSEYACGMTVGAPHGDAPCTKDPKFPRFDDYVLDAGLDGEVWCCYASAANALSPAGVVRLDPTYHRRCSDGADQPNLQPGRAETRRSISR